MEHYTFKVIDAGYDTQTVSLDEIANDLRRFYQAGDVAWVLVSSILVFLMSLGMAMFYSGLARPSNNLYMAWLPLMAASLAGLEWYLWCYAAVFSNSPNSHFFWGGTDGVALHNTLLRPIPWNPTDARGGGSNAAFVPEIVYVLFEGMFASFTAALISAAAAYKERPGHFLVFVLLWLPFVYTPIARWTWSTEGWAKTRGVLDFAGGAAVHICAGATVLAHSVFHTYLLGPFESTVLCWLADKIRAPREEQPQIHHSGPKTSTQCVSSPDARYTDISRLVFGTALLWTGWFGFNGGSALGANLRAASACVSTHLAACTGAVFNAIFAMVFHRVSSGSSPANNQPGEDANPNANPNQRYPFNPIQFCNGAIIALVAITPAAGFVPHWVAPVFGIIPNFLVNILLPLSLKVGDDLYVFVIHAVSGFIGMILTGVFAKGDVAALDGFAVAEDNRGGIDGYRNRVGWQVAGSLAALGYAFSVSLALLYLLEIPMFFLGRHCWRRTTSGRRREIVDMDVLSHL